MHKEIDITLLDTPALNRKFDQFGPKWDSLLESVRTHGILQPLLVRPMPKGRYEIMAGNRRKAAGQKAGLFFMPCMVREMSDREALEVLLIENLEREDPDPIEEGKLLRAAMEEGLEIAILAHRIKRSVEWIMTRQQLLDLGDEVLEAVRKPKEAPGHLGMGTVEVILSVPVESRELAIQLVLHPEWSSEVLGPREAENVIRSVITEPSRKRKMWEKESLGLARAWKKSLATYLSKDEKKELIVQPIRFEEAETTKLKTRADELIPTERRVSGDDSEKRWVHLAVFHGLPVWVIPGEATGEADVSHAVVDERLIVLAESARAENGLPCTLLTEKERKSKEILKRETTIEKAIGEIEGEGDPNYETDEKPTVTIEQQMESRAWVDLGPVRALREQLRSLEWPDDDLPPAAPAWLKAIWESEFNTADLVALCDWIEGLKR